MYSDNTRRRIGSVDVGNFFFLLGNANDNGLLHVRGLQASKALKNQICGQRGMPRCTFLKKSSPSTSKSWQRKRAATAPPHTVCGRQHDHDDSRARYTTTPLAVAIATLPVSGDGARAWSISEAPVDCQKDSRISETFLANR